MTLAYAHATATGAMTTIPTRLHGIYICGSAAAMNVTVTNGNGGATVLYIGVGAANASNSFTFPEPIFLQNGVYVTVTGASANVTIAYS